MRHKIWEKDDHFEVGGKRVDMDPSVVELPEEAHLVWEFNWDDKRGPYGSVTDIRLEDGEITAKIKFFDPSWDEELLKSCRFAGYYTKVEKNAEGSQVTKCKLKGVSVVPISNVPGAS